MTPVGPVHCRGHHPRECTRKKVELRGRRPGTCLGSWSQPCLKQASTSVKVSLSEAEPGFHQDCSRLLFLWFTLAATDFKCHLWHLSSQSPACPAVRAAEATVWPGLGSPCRPLPLAGPVPGVGGGAAARSHPRQGHRRRGAGPVCSSLSLPGTPRWCRTEETQVLTCTQVQSPRARGC